MQWSTEPQAGFTKNEKPILPVISEGPYVFQHINVADQRYDPESMLNWMERLIWMRKEAPEIGWGDFTCLETGDHGVLALRYDWRNNSILIIHNLKSQPVEVKINPDGGTSDGCWQTLLTEPKARPTARGKHCIYLEAFAYRWFRVGGLDYLLRRTEL